MPKNKYSYLSSFILKIIAMIAVLSDHIAYAFIGPGPVIYDIMRIIGRLAFILFAFFISEGVVKSRNRNRYLLRLFIMYAILQIMIVIGVYRYMMIPYPNIFATLLGGASLLVYLENKRWNHVYYLIPFIAVMVINYLVHYQNITNLMIYSGDYAFYGLAVIFMFYVARKLALYLYAKYPPTLINTEENNKTDNEAKKQQVLNVASSVSLLFVTFIWYILSVFKMSSTNMVLQSYALLAIPLLLLYSGKLGHNSKPFRTIYYLFFPVHLIIIALLLFIFRLI